MQHKNGKNSLKASSKFSSTEEVLTQNQMVQKINEHINGILRENLYEMNLSMAQMQRLSGQKQELRRNLKNCGTGDANARDFMIDFIEECLLKLFSLGEDSINKTFFYAPKSDTNPEYQFDKLLFYYRKAYGCYGLERMLEEHRLLDTAGKNTITAEDIGSIYGKLRPVLDFAEKLQLLSYKVYAAYKGLGVIDELREMHI